MSKTEVNTELFEKNLKLLYPSLRESLRNIKEEELRERIEITYNDQGDPVCRCRRDKGVFHITGQNPKEEAERWYDTVDDHGTGAIFLFGCGFGYSLLEVFRRKQPQTLVVLFEKDLYLFAAMLRYFDLEPIAVTKKIAFVVGEGECFREAFENLFSSFNLIVCSYPTIACTLPSMRNFKAEYLELMRTLFRQLTLFVTFVGNDHGDNLTGFCNLMANTKEIIQNPCLSCLKDKFKNVPAFIIANGPSLDKNIEELKNIRGRGLILSVESAILPLLRNGIEPDILTVIERTKETYRFHFENAVFPDNTALICLAVVDRRVLSSFRGQKIPVLRKQEAINEWINQSLGDGSGVNTGPNVSHLATELANYLGADPIVYVGQDFAYGPDGLTHSRDSVYNEARGEQARKTVQSRQVVYTEGNDGSLLATNHIWNEFRLELERRISSLNGKTIINATEGGAKIQGTDCQRLCDVIERYCRTPLPCRVSRIISENRKTKPEEDMRERFVPFIETVESYAERFRGLVRESAQRKRESKRALYLSRDKGRKGSKTQLTDVYRENNDFFVRLITDEIFRYFTQQEIYVNYYLMNRLGRMDTPEKITELFKIQYAFCSHLNAIVQSVSVHMENAARELRASLGEPEAPGAGGAVSFSGKKRLSLCILARNDERYITDCIHEMRRTAEEILVADLRSSDKTAETARRAGAEVLPIRFDGDFAAVKNLCLEYARGDWVLFMRASERIEEEKKTELLALLGNPNAEGYLMNLENYPENYAVFSPVQSLRMIRKRKGSCFRYKSFDSAAEPFTGIYDAFIPIRCLNEPALAAETEERGRLLEREAEALPEDGYLQYMRGIMRINGQKYEEGIACLRSALKAAEIDSLHMPHLFKCLGWALLATQRYDEALEILRDGIAEFPHYTDLLVLRSELFRQLGNNQEAAADLKKCLKTMELPNLLVPVPEIAEDSVREILQSILPPPGGRHNGQ